MTLDEILDKICWTACHSLYDGSYIGVRGDLHFLEKYQITEQVQSVGDGKTACLGFCPDEQKWYGWSHRAIYGFGIGSQVAKGSCAYTPSSLAEFVEEQIAFYEGIGAEVLENNMLNVKTTESSGLLVPIPDEFGRGEWTAETLDDAKQMAIDFARGVS